MSFETLFSIANGVAMLGWLALIFLPGRPWVREGLSALVIPGLLAVAYLVLLATFMPGAEGGFDSLAAVAKLFEQPALLLAGWIHYLAFDLFVGAWIAREGQRAGVPHLALLPAFILTFLAGPVGFLAFLATRRVLSRQPMEALS